LVIWGAGAIATALTTGTAQAQQGPAAAGNDMITAIDILLEPDATMLKAALKHPSALLRGNSGGNC
jgi:hypothetical protein